MSANFDRALQKKAFETMPTVEMSINGTALFEGRPDLDTFIAWLRAYANAVEAAKEREVDYIFMKANVHTTG